MRLLFSIIKSIVDVFSKILEIILCGIVEGVKKSKSSQKIQQNKPVSRISTRPAASKPKPVPRSVTMSRIDKMDGHDFEHFTAELLKKLGNKPVQEVHAGKTIYGCSVAVVLTNNYFTEGGKEAARALGVELWDRDKLERMLTYAAHMAGRSTC